jgi:predicted deacetylase
VSIAHSMNPWLTAPKAALDGRSSPMTVFFRDDDAGWNNARLLALLDLFEKHGVPIDLAVIPDALDADLAAELVRRRTRNSGLLGLHQHGYHHVNHETDGRKCEFGVSRSYAEQFGDLAAGRRRLHELLGIQHLDAIFTPPWNRCTQATVDCLAELGLRTLSRAATAAALDVRGLGELPVHVDWCKAKGTLAEKRKARSEWLSAAFASFATTGIMLHHAVMDNEDLSEVEQLLELLTHHGETCCHLMSQLIGHPTPIAVAV